MENLTFKAKRIDNGEFVEGWFTKKKIGNLIVPVIERYIENDSGDYIESYEIDGKTLEQIQDKNVVIINKEESLIMYKSLYELRKSPNGLSWDEFELYKKFQNNI